MKKDRIFIGTIIGALFLVGCSQKELDVKGQTLNSSKIEKKSKEVESTSPILEVVTTTVKPEIDVVRSEKVSKGEVPLVVVDAVEEGSPVKEVDILPVVDDTLDVVTKVKPTIEMIDVIEDVPVD
jgi:PBP1b-binding outer membrane lipoprotein LpoB